MICMNGQRNNIRLQDGLVSIIMPAYNSSEFIAESIDSVLSQTYQQWELLIIDDCSTDNTVDIVAGFDDERIRCIRHSENMGVAVARNTGIGMARGRFLAFLDSDDLWLPQKLEKQLDFIKHNNYAFTYTEYKLFCTADGIGKAVHTRDYVDYETLLKGNDIGCLTVVIDRWKHGNIVMPNSRHEDYLTWLSLLRNGGRAYAMHEDLARYRKSAASLTGNKWQSMMWTWDVYRKYQGLSFWKSCYYMSYYIKNGVFKHYGI